MDSSNRILLPEIKSYDGEIDGRLFQINPR